MNLSTLPDELLINVLKHSKWETIQDLRRINGRIDGLSKKSGMARMPIYAIKIYSDKATLIYYQKNGYKTSSDHQLPANDRIGYLEIIEKLLRLVKITHMFGMWKCQDFDQDLLTIILKNRKAFEKVTLINFNRFWFVTHRNTLANFFLKICPNLNTLVIHMGAKYMSNSEVMGNLNISDSLINDGESTLDDDFLLKVVTKTKRFALHEDNNGITLNGIINTLKKKILTGNLEGSIHIAAINLGSVDLQDVERLFKSNFEIIYIRMRNIRSQTMWREYYIAVKHNTKKCDVRFRIAIPE